MLLSFGFLVVLLLFSAAFSAAELAFFSLRKGQIEAYKQNASPKKSLQLKRVEKLRQRSSRLLITILLGNNLVNVGASVLATVIATELAIKANFSDHTSLVMGIVTGVMTLSILLFSEITPKALGHRYALQYALIFAPFLQLCQWVGVWLIVPLEKILKTFVTPGLDFEKLNARELKAMVQLSERDGAINPNQRQWLEHTLELHNHRVETIMTPRSRSTTLVDSWPIEKALEVINQHHYSRFPVLHNETVTGVLTVHNLLEVVQSTDWKKKKVANIPLVPPLKIPYTMRLDHLFRLFLKESKHMAMVLDEHGGFIGLVTMEDILEEIFGTIVDEQDEPESDAIRRTGKNTFLISGSIELEEIETYWKSELGTEAPESLPWNLKQENETLAHLILSYLERFPHEGEVMTLKSESHSFVCSIEVMEKDSIQQVRIDLLPHESLDAENDEE